MKGGQTRDVYLLVQVALVLGGLEPSDHVHYREAALVPQRLGDSKHLGLHVPAEVPDPPLVAAHSGGPDVEDQVLGLLQDLYADNTSALITHLMCRYNRLGFKTNSHPDVHHWIKKNNLQTQTTQYILL